MKVGPKTLGFNHYDRLAAVHQSIVNPPSPSRILRSYLVGVSSIPAEFPQKWVYQGIPS
jgi:hypothetical protein